MWHDFHMQICMAISFFKVVRVVKIKLFFYGLILLKCDNTNWVMQNPMEEYRQSSIVFKKLGILPENLKTLYKLQLPCSSIFLAETSHRLPTYQCLRKDVQDFFYFVWILSYLQKLKRPGLYTLLFTFLLITQDLHKIKKKPQTSFCRLY